MVLLRDAARQFVADRAAHHAAALAYYALFSVGPLLLVAAALAGMVLGHDQARTAILAEVRTLVGPQAAGSLEALMADGATRGSWGALAAGTAALLVGAAGVFRHLQDSLDAVWGVRRIAPDGWKARVRAALQKAGVGVAGVISTGFLLLVSLLAGAAIRVLAERGRSVLPGGTGWWTGMHLLASVLVASMRLRSSIVTCPRPVWRGGTWWWDPF